MKNASTLLALFLSFQAFGAETTLLCNDQNSHSVYRLQLAEDLRNAKLTAVIGDSSVLSAGTKNLKFEEGESSEELATFGGKTNSGLSLALLFNAQKAAELKPLEILEVSAYYQQHKGDILSGNTLFLCSKK